MAVKQINLLSQLFKARRVGYKARRVGYNSSRRPPQAQQNLILIKLIKSRAKTI